MNELKEYRRRARVPVTAVQLDFETEGFTYRKWGGIQTAAPGDWVVNRDGDAYTVAREVFERTYRMISQGVYEKVTPVWARVAESSGVVPTHEGETHYSAGDMLVFNDPDGLDGYAMTPEAFAELYEPAP